MLVPDTFTYLLAAPTQCSVCCSGPEAKSANATHHGSRRFPSPPSHSRAPAVPQVLHHPQTMEDWRSAFNEEWDAVVMGTGMKECLLSGLLSVAGKKVLHVDRNNYYGGASASLDIQQLFSKFAGSAEPSAL